MGLAGLVFASVGIVVVVLSANGRLQNVIAAAFGQQSPQGTPLSGSQNTGATGSGDSNFFNDLGNFLSGDGTGTQYGGDGTQVSGDPNETGGYYA